MFNLIVFISNNLISDHVSEEVKNLLKGNYVEVLQDNLFLNLYNEFENLNKSNFGSDLLEHLQSFMLSNPLLYVSALKKLI